MFNQFWVVVKEDGHDFDCYSIRLLPCEMFLNVVCIKCFKGIVEIRIPYLYLECSWTPIPALQLFIIFTEFEHR